MGAEVVNIPEALENDSREVKATAMTKSFFSMKRRVREALNHSSVLNQLKVCRIERKIRSPDKHGQPTFSEQVLFENARKRLKGDLVGKIHPQKHFRDKENQKHFMQAIGAQSPKQIFLGSAEGISSLGEGRYFVKPLQGSGAKGALAIERCGRMIKVAGIEISVADFPFWYETACGARAIIVEELLEDLVFDSLLDYKAYCFFEGGVDHVLCMQRRGAITAASFSADGHRICTGKDVESPMSEEIDPELVAEIAARAEHFAKRIPLSFVRLDFFISKAGILLGEVTPLPGNSEGFSAERDRTMGRKWLGAREAVSRSASTVIGYRYFVENGLEVY
jgi:hypothetical protein